MKQYFAHFKRLWMKFAHVLGVINGRIIFTIIYLVVFGLYAIPSKIYGVCTSPKIDAGWQTKKKHSEIFKNLERQF